MLVNISFDSLGWNALHCGIDAKVRRKNEIARVLSKNFRVLIRKRGIRVRNPGVWRMKSNKGHICTFTTFPQFPHKTDLNFYFFVGI